MTPIFKSLALALLLLGILARGIIADGMMPDFNSANPFSVMICDGDMAHMNTFMPMPDHGKGHQGGHVTCPYALTILPVTAMDAVIAVLILLAIAVILDSRIAAFILAVRKPSAEPRGPPLFSV